MTTELEAADDAVAAKRAELDQLGAPRSALTARRYELKQEIRELDKLIRETDRPYAKAQKEYGALLEKADRLAGIEPQSLDRGG